MAKGYSSFKSQTFYLTTRSVKFSKLCGMSTIPLIAPCLPLGFNLTALKGLHRAHRNPEEVVPKARIVLSLYDCNLEI